MSGTGSLHRRGEVTLYKEIQLANRSGGKIVRNSSPRPVQSSHNRSFAGAFPEERPPSVRPSARR